MFGGVVNAADKRHRLIDHHNFAVHAAEKIGAHAEQARAGIVVAENHARGRQFIDELIAQIRRAVAVEQHFDFDAARAARSSTRAAVCPRHLRTR
jgi:hypothetical protein